MVSLGGKWLIIMDRNVTMNATMQTNMNPVYIFFTADYFSLLERWPPLFLPLFSQFESSPGTVWCCNLSNIAPTQCHTCTCMTSTCMIFTAISCLIYYTVCACIAINLSCIITVHNIFLRYCNSHVLINSTHQRSFILNKSSSHINSY